MSLMRIPRKVARRARFRWCALRGHRYPTRDVDGIMAGHPVRLKVCAGCEVVLSGDVLPPRRIRRLATRRGLDPIGLVGPDGLPIRRRLS